MSNNDLDEKLEKILLGEMQECIKLTIFAAIEYGKNNAEATQDALDASYYGNVEQIIEDLKDCVPALKAAFGGDCLELIPGDNYAPTGNLVAVEATNAERQRQRQAIRERYMGEGSDEQK